MIKQVFITATNCVTPIGFDVAANIKNIEGQVSAIKLHDNTSLMKSPFYAAIINDDKLNSAFANITKLEDFTRLEKMMILALEPVIRNSKVKLDKRTAFILSTTKGNITALKDSSAEGFEKAKLNTLAKAVGDFFGFLTEPIVISNACVSGVLAISVAKRLIQAGMYDDVFIVAGDEVSEFVLSGFTSFQAISDLPCRPYSANRTGVTLGEAAAAVLVSSNGENAMIKIVGDGSINDANHISGPSRTGEGLVKSIASALAEARVEAKQLDYISAHGTATPFNDEMEAIALNHLGLEDVPVNSLKGFYGHTLGASGLLETVIGIESVNQGRLFMSMGFDESGVSVPINIIEKNANKDINYFLKTASGFGGCNTAVLFKKAD